MSDRRACSHYQQSGYPRDKKEILESIKEGLKGIENFQKRAGFLRSDKELSKQVFPILSEEKLNEKGVADLEAFLKATRARIESPLVS